MSRLNPQQMTELVKLLLSSISPEEGIRWAVEGEGTLSLIAINLPPSLADQLKSIDEKLVEFCEKCQKRPTCEDDKYLRKGDLINELMTRCVVLGFEAFLRGLFKEQ